MENEKNKIKFIRYFCRERVQLLNYSDEKWVKIIYANEREHTSLKGVNVLLQVREQRIEGKWWGGGRGRGGGGLPERVRPGARFSKVPKSRKLFGPAKPFLTICILKAKYCIGMKLCMKGIILHIQNMWKEQLCKLKAWDFCYGFFSGSEHFSGTLRNGPQGLVQPRTDLFVSCTDILLTNQTILSTKFTTFCVCVSQNI